jgi:hypothetical protein
LLAFLDNTDELFAALLRRGNAGSNTAVDHIAVLDAALSQLPDHYRHGHPILIRADGAGCTKAFLPHVRSLREQGINCEFFVGWTMGLCCLLGSLPAGVRVGQTRCAGRYPAAIAAASSAKKTRCLT